MDRQERRSQLAIMRWAAVVFVGASAFIAARADVYSGTCPNGAPAKYERYCPFFKQFNNNPNSTLDTQIADILGIKTADETRSIALIITISKYPLMPGNNISAAAVDGERLTDFLINDQKFDEVIVLRDEDATAETINYFLEEYLIDRAVEFNKKARLLIAYSGHGTSDTPTTQASFVLSAANKPTDSAHTYKMKNFSGDVQELAKQYFHVLTLINACYGGSFFTSAAPGGNPAAPELPGSYAITAGSARDETRSLDINRGSLFFDLVIEGIKKGIADREYWVWHQVNEGGNVTALNGLTRTQPLSTFLTDAYDSINKNLSRTNMDFQKLSKPWIGAAQTGVAEGAFFFVSKQGMDSPLVVVDPYIRTKMASNNTPDATASFGLMDDKHKATALVGDQETLAINAELKDQVVLTVGEAIRVKRTLAANSMPLSQSSVQSTQITELPPGPISSIHGRPDIKIFKPPFVYRIRGYDFSSADGHIDWKAFANVRPRFVYARAIGWRGPDQTFLDRWSNAKVIGVDYGAYLKFDFCRSPKEQMERLTKIVPLDPNALPLAINIVNPWLEDDRQFSCLERIGMEKTKVAILKLASDIRARYGKTPLLYGNRYNLSTFLDQRSYEFMVWLGSYGASGIKLSGHNPWTLWQYSGTLNIKGVGPKTTGEVFFGTEEQYKLFKAGKSNIALDAVR
jgi:GH25 family lysozyme M1 (1,4-beta-N-acetylmuramidase)